MSSKTAMKFKFSRAWTGADRFAGFPPVPAVTGNRELATDIYSAFFNSQFAIYNPQLFDQPHPDDNERRPDDPGDGEGFL